VAANAISPSRLGFDLFELDPSNFELRRKGVPVDVPPQALRILLLLAAHPNELVGRKKIKEALWPGQAYGDFDSRLNFAVKKLREALGDDAGRPRYVQTVRNAGYRFIAPLHELQAFSSRLPNSVASSVSSGSGTLYESRPGARALGIGPGLGRGGLVLVFATAVLMAVAAGAVLTLGRGDPGQASVATKAPAVVNLEQTPEITFVSAILPVAGQKIVIRGHGFGMHVPYIQTDSPFLAIRDQSAHWAAGRIAPHNWDEVMLNVESWSDAEVVISGFSGDYGKGEWKLAAGDAVEVAIWNPQSGVGPALFHLTVSAAP